MKHYKITIAFRYLLASLVLLFASTPLPAYALLPSEYSDSEVLYYNPSARLKDCIMHLGTPTGFDSVSTGNGANGNTDYAGRQIISDDQLAKIKQFQPVYESAAKAANIPWQVLAVVHIRESNLMKGNPSNGQGVYQDYALEGAPPGNEIYPPGSIDDGEFLRQTIWAANFLKEKAGSKADLVARGDTEAIKAMFFSYNGEAAVYTAQAERMGFEEGYEGSPYVMNKADARRDPDVAKQDGTWGQIMTDNGRISYPAGDDYGAFIMYAALAGVQATSTSSGGCIPGGSIDPRVGANGWPTSGPNSMVIYYQDEAPWDTKPYGGTIKACGCGPTSMAMAIATLNRDSSINPETMSNFFIENGYLHGGCGTQFQNGNDSGPFGTVAEKFGVTITELGTDLNKAAEAVKRGSFVFLSSFGTNDSASGIYAFGGPNGHLMLIRGVTDSGNFLFADPNKNWGDPAMSDKTHNDEGFPASAFQSGIQLMYEIRKAGS